MIKQATQGMKAVTNEHIGLLTLIKGIIVSYIITIPAFIIFAFILTYTSFPEKFISPAVIITTIVSILTAGSAVTKNLKNKGWLNGSIVGLVYMAALYIASSIIFRDFSINRYVVTMMMVGIITGSIGGIVGINLKRGTHSGRKQYN